MARDGCHRAGPYTPSPSACRLRLVSSESLDRAADPWWLGECLRESGGVLEGLGGCLGGSVVVLRVANNVGREFVAKEGPTFDIVSWSVFVMPRAFEQAIGRPATPKL